jgi:hypothetical protein
MHMKKADIKIFSTSLIAKSQLLATKHGWLPILQSFGPNTSLSLLHRAFMLLLDRISKTYNMLCSRRLEHVQSLTPESRKPQLIISISCVFLWLKRLSRIGGLNSRVQHILRKNSGLVRNVINRRVFNHHIPIRARSHVQQQFDYRLRPVCLVPKQSQIG